MELFERAESRRFLAGQLIWFLAWVFVTAFAIYLKPDPAGHGTHQSLGLPPCPSVLLFDRPCPGCGLTTSWTAFVHGQLGLSFRAHPLGPFLYSVFTITAIGAIIGWAKGLRFRGEAPWPSRILTGCVIVFIGFGVIRMATTSGIRTPQEQWLSNLSQGR